ncbi:MAG TPA: amidohydrolase family protein [Candidatus Nanopelagicales bacterium]|nr:amidohydrolase family protein [Candidatus Nanopelagicales bacterium]
MSTDADLPRLWQELGVPGTIDIHTHFLPAPVMQAVWAYFDEAEANYGVSWPITYRWQDDARLAHLRAMGILHFTALVYAHKSGMAAWLNDWALDFAESVPECLPSATFFPEPDASVYVDEALRRGARVFKVHLQVGDFDPRDRLLDPVWGHLADAGIPVVTHCGSAPLPGRFTGAGPIGEVARRFPSLRLVVAHLGAGEFADFLEMARTRPNTWLDTTMGLTGFMEGLRPFPQALLPQLRDASRDGQVLFGSDFPNIPYPYAHQVDVLIEHGLDMPEVLWRAPARLLGVPA